MSKPKTYQDQFTSERRLAWLRFKAQCRFRQESFDLTFQEFCDFWHDPQMWANRGRSPDDLVLTRRDHKKSWSVKNCWIIQRRDQLTIRNLRRFNKDYMAYQREVTVYA